jgi:hypothetical protein
VHGATRGHVAAISVARTTIAALRDLRRGIVGASGADRTNVVDGLRGEAQRGLAMRAPIARQRAQDALCATIEGVGSIRDPKCLARVLRAV